MREIKFRQLLKSGRFHYWGYIDGAFISPVGKGEGNGKSQQFTGLKDKRRTKKHPEGKEIYEGDVIKSEWNDRYPYLNGEIVFDEREAEFRWYAEFPGGGGVSCGLGHYLDGPPKYVGSGTGGMIIGNVSRNRKLLKNKKAKRG